MANVKSCFYFVSGELGYGLDNALAWDQEFFLREAFGTYLSSSSFPLDTFCRGGQGELAIGGAGTGVDAGESELGLLC